MAKSKTIISNNAVELARTIGLSASDGSRWELRSQLVSKIIQVALKEKLTHSNIAKRVGTSRTRVTAILNRNIDDVSTDLLLRILESLGFRITLSISKSKLVA